MDVTGEGQRDRPALRVHRLGVVVRVLGFTIGRVGGLVPARIVGFGGGLGLDLVPFVPSVIDCSIDRCNSTSGEVGHEPECDRRHEQQRDHGKGKGQPVTAFSAIYGRMPWSLRLRTVVI
jgi:hypothetical protein